MRGMNNKTGKELEGIKHLKQSMIDILTTPTGSRIMRRDYWFEIV
jgi:phage baseplate assembly protein W